MFLICAKQALLSFQWRETQERSSYSETALTASTAVEELRARLGTTSPTKECSPKIAPVVWNEDIVSFIGSIRWDNQPEDSINHSSNKFRHLLKVHPDAIEEMRPPASANRRARQYAENASTFDLRGDIVSKTLHLYGAKLALALHWSGTGQILPCGSKIGVYCMSNERRFAKTVPQHLFELIPNHREIRQGKKASRYPFYYSSGRRQTRVQRRTGQPLLTPLRTICSLEEL